MKNKWIALIGLACFWLQGFSQPAFVTVFESGKEGYHSFRIPALVQLPNGELLAFCEGRVNSRGDYGNNDLVLKRSTDGGRSWSALQVVADWGDLQLCNPAPVVDLTDPAFPGGRIFLFYNTGNSAEREVLKGNGLKRCLYKTSADNGHTWSEAVDITQQVHRPNQPAADPKFNFAEDWRYYANTPGHALQIQSGKYQGRIFVAANHTAGDPPKGQSPYVAHGYYTDDHGKTFQLGQSVALQGSNESSAAEISDSRLMMNSRNQQGDVRARIVSVSSDGGATWDTTYFDRQLTDPVCQGSILNLPDRKKKTLAFCNNADPKNRNNLTLRISRDEGKTWAKTIPVYRGASEPKANYAWSAYSDLVALGKKKVGILFEQDDYTRIVFTTVKW